jgi:hypothetical protein
VAGNLQSATIQSAIVPRRRLLIALAIALVSAAICYARLVSAEIVAADFTFPWRGARFLLAGENPYAMVRPDGPYPFNDGLYYPLPGLLLVIPFAPLPGSLAGALFTGLSAGLLAYGLLREGAHRLLVFASVPYLYALITCQWAPLIAAAALLPNLAPALLAKPNLGLPVLVAYGTRRHLLLCAATLLLSLAVWPGWPAAWLAAIPQHLNYTPLLSWWGPVLLLALWRWRAPAARLLVAMALMPQRLLYDQVGLWLIPATPRQSLALTAASWLGLLLGLLTGEGRWALACAYLPALAIVLLQGRQAHTEPTS